MKRQFLAASSALLLAGCATSKTMMVDDRTAMISANDRGWGAEWGVNLDMKVIRGAAEMAQARGFENFQILSANDTSRSGVVPIAGSSTTNTYGNAYCYGTWCSGRATTTTYGTPGYLAPYTISGKNIIVRFLHANEVTADMPNVYTTAAVLSTK
jgi:hypothetical protein